MKTFKSFSLNSLNYVNRRTNRINFSKLFSRHQEFMSVKYRQRHTWVISFIWVLLVSEYFYFIVRPFVMTKAFRIYAVSLLLLKKAMGIQTYFFNDNKSRNIMNDVLSSSVTSIIWTYKIFLFVIVVQNFFMQKKNQNHKKLCWSCVQIYDQSIKACDPISVLFIPSFFKCMTNKMKRCAHLFWTQTFSHCRAFVFYQQRCVFVCLSLLNKEMLRDERDKWKKSASTAEFWNAEKRPMNSLNDVDEAGMETDKTFWTWSNF